jgi:hypothetical protein
MKPIIYISCLCLIFCLGCKKKDNSAFSEITFTGMDLTMRPCSGGFIGTMGNEHCRAFDIVSNTILTDSTLFPQTYYIQYERPSGGCYNEVDGTSKIKITAIQMK